MPTLSIVVTIAVAFLLALTIVGALWLLIKIIRQCRSRGISLLMIEGGAISPASLQALVLIFATIVGGLWVIFTVFVTGGIDLQRTLAEKARIDREPELAIDMKINSLSPKLIANSMLYPVNISVELENKASREIGLLEFDKIPLLVIANVQGLNPTNAVTGPVIALPYVKIECRISFQCTIAEWRKGVIIGNGGKGYYSFLHPGLPVGVYYIQFQLPVPDEFLSKGAG